MERKKRTLDPDLPPRSDPNYGRLYREKNKARQKELHKDWYIKNPDRISEQSKRHRSKPETKVWRREYDWKRIGINDFSYDRYLIELANQQNMCKICEEIMESPHVDHDHNTGEFRGLLCIKCNMGLGIYENHRDKFEKYIIEHKIRTDF